MKEAEDRKERGAEVGRGRGYQGMSWKRRQGGEGRRPVARRGADVTSGWIKKVPIKKVSL